MTDALGQLYSKHIQEGTKTANLAGNPWLKSYDRKASTDQPKTTVTYRRNFKKNNVEDTSPSSFNVRILFGSLQGDLRLIFQHF